MSEGKKWGLPGRSPTLPDGLEDYLEDLIDRTWAWIYRYRRVWHDGYNPECPIDHARWEGEFPAVLEQYDNAIKALDLMQEDLKWAKESLVKGKQAAQKRLKKEKDQAAQENNPSKQSEEIQEYKRAPLPPSDFDDILEPKKQVVNPPRGKKGSAPKRKARPSPDASSE